MGTVVVFKLDEQKLALTVNTVQCVLRAVEITQIPGQSPNLVGVIDAESMIIPIIALRKIIGLPARELELEDHILVVETKFGTTGMIVDSVEGVMEYENKQFTAVEQQSLSYTSGILKVEDELLAVIDPSKLVAAKDLLMFKKQMAEAIN